MQSDFPPEPTPAGTFDASDPVVRSSRAPGVGGGQANDHWTYRTSSRGRAAARWTDPADDKTQSRDRGRYTEAAEIG